MIDGELQIALATLLGVYPAEVVNAEPTGYLVSVKHSWESEDGKTGGSHTTTHRVEIS
jgi:hypothetical protein